MKDNNIEDLFKEKFENFEADVNPRVWKKIQIGLKGAGLTALMATIYYKIGTKGIIAIVSSVITVISAVLVMHWIGNSPEKKNSATEKNCVISETIVNKQESIPTNENQNTLSKKEDSVQPDAKKVVVINTNQENMKETESAINTFSAEPIALISASKVGGSVPLIVSLENKGSGKTNRWEFNDGEKVSNMVSPVHIFEEPGVYTVKLISTNAKGKTAVDSVKVEAISNSASSASSSFSPNGDGKNDVFLFQSQNIVTMSAEIVDKKGNIIYKWEGIDGKWDGKNQKGKDAKEGIYFYIISAQGLDGKKFERQGAINLTR